MRLTKPHSFDFKWLSWTLPRNPQGTPSTGPDKDMRSRACLSLCLHPALTSPCGSLKGVKCAMLLPPGPVNNKLLIFIYLVVYSWTEGLSILFHLTNVDVTKLYGFAQFLRGGSHRALARWGAHREAPGSIRRQGWGQDVGLYGSFCGKESVRPVTSSGLTSLNNFSWFWVEDCPCLSGTWP